MAIGSAILGASASATAAGIVGGLVVAGAAATLAGAFIETPDSPASLGLPIDKTTADAQKELDAPLIGDEKARKRKAAASKSQFKVDKTPTESGVNLQGTDKVTGVQL